MFGRMTCIPANTSVDPLRSLSLCSSKLWENIFNEKKKERKRGIQTDRKSIKFLIEHPPPPRRDHAKLPLSFITKCSNLSLSINCDFLYVWKLFTQWLNLGLNVIEYSNARIQIYLFIFRLVLYRWGEKKFNLLRDLGIVSSILPFLILTLVFSIRKKETFSIEKIKYSIKSFFLVFFYYKKKTNKLTLSINFQKKKTCFSRDVDLEDLSSACFNSTSACLYLLCSLRSSDCISFNWTFFVKKKQKHW